MTKTAIITCFYQTTRPGLPQPVNSHIQFRHTGTKMNQALARNLAAERLRATGVEPVNSVVLVAEEVVWDFTDQEPQQEEAPVERAVAPKKTKK